MEEGWGGGGAGCSKLGSDKNSSAPNSINLLRYFSNLFLVLCLY